MPGDESSSVNTVPDATTTSELVLRVQDGDDEAYSRLVATFAPLLRRWAHGRVPSAARGAVDTEDIVQETLLSVHRRVGSLQVERPGAFWLYLRRSVQSRLSNSARTAARRPSADVDIADASIADPRQYESELIDYERGLEKLAEEERAIIVLRLEFGLSHQEVATALGLASADAARMRATRAVSRLAELIG